MVSNWGGGDREFSLVIENNPLTELVEVPASLSALNYSQIIAGAIRGGLEALHFKVRFCMVVVHDFKDCYRCTRVLSKTRRTLK